jgi:hypothetical protein
LVGRDDHGHAILSIHSSGGYAKRAKPADRSASFRLLHTRDLRTTAPADIGGNYSFYGMTAPELWEKLAAVQTDKRGLFHVTDGD